jgi:hypothetical protein
MIAALAAMAEVRQVREVAGREFPPHGHGGEHRAIALAIPAGIADFHLPPRFGGGFSFAH